MNTQPRIAVLIPCYNEKVAISVVVHDHTILFCPYADPVHHESYTRGKSTRDPHPEDSVLFRTKWQGLLHVGDPHFNPGLSQNSTTWQMKQPMNCGFDIRRRIFRRDATSGRQMLTHSQ